MHWALFKVIKDERLHSAPGSPVAKGGWMKERYLCTYYMSVTVRAIMCLLYVMYCAYNYVSIKCQVPHNYYALVYVMHYAFLFNVILIYKHSFR